MNYDKGDSNPLVSIVLPIYNVAPYLDRCMQSIVNQSYKNLEIIMVDDGSTDASSELCDEWNKHDNRVKVIHKPNAGLGEARNTGIENATGDYVCFFDSDDYIRLDAIEMAVSSALHKQSDVVLWGWGGVTADGSLYITHVPNPPYKYYSGKEIIERLLPEMVSGSPKKDKNWHLYMSAWSMMYSMAIIKDSGWRFVSERKIISEDVYSLLDLFSHIRNVSIIDDYLYFYCVNGDSLTRKYRPDRFVKIKEFYLKTLKLCKEKNYPDEIMKRVKGLFVSFTIAALKQESANKPFNNATIRKMLQDNEFVDAIVKYKEIGLKREAFRWAVINRQISLCELMLWFQNKS